MPPYIKKLVMYGFKSFPRKTELPFTSEINVILGPNGSGKSNITDALCFVLGRLSAKSMRAAKASNLIFQGTKVFGPSKEAYVEIVFDNSDRAFSIDVDEVVVRRIVRKNGAGIYKINNETRTRQDVLFLLAQAGIDSNGFNLILQGEIQNLVRMHADDRRKIIEEVSGISIYEVRKERSLKELTKTEDRLKEIHAILRERTSYLNNLEKERQQALRFKKLEEDIKKFKASIIYFDLTRKKKEIQKVDEEILKKNNEVTKGKKAILDLRTAISNYESRVSSINASIQKSEGIEQEKLNQEIANLRADIAGLNVKVENYKNKLSEINKEKEELQRIISEGEISVRELKMEAPTLTKKQKDVESKKEELEKLEDQRKKFYTIKSELKSIKQRLEDKKNLLQTYNGESDLLVRQINMISEELFDKKTDEEKVNSLKHLLEERKNLLEELIKRESELDKIAYSNENEIDKQKKFVEKLSKIEICPVCKSEITDEHIHSIENETNTQIDFLERATENSDKQLDDISKKKDILKQDLEQISLEIRNRESDLVKIASVEEKKENIKNLQEKIDVVKAEISEIDKIKFRLEKNFNESSNIEQRYDTVKIEVQEVSLRTDENVDTEISFKQREVERSKVSLKQLVREFGDLKEELVNGENDLDKKDKSLVAKRKREEELNIKFKKFISERDSIQKKIRNEEYNIMEKQNSISSFDQAKNHLNIDKARFNAEVENLEKEMLDFHNVEVIKTNRESLVSRLDHLKDMISRIGSVNLLSLEVYDSVKKEYDSVKEKAETIDREKNSILKVIHEIDIKKKKTFMTTLNQLNEIFSRNFANLSTKGKVSLELENRKDPFDGGVNIIVKTGHGKYFDVTSLSGGEQTLVALALIFGIQELKPYCFYVLDEIDAALDKRNSERLAGLLKKYMQKGQYIVITHNDEIITNASNLYGVSMHEGVSKIISLKI